MSKELEALNKIAYSYGYDENIKIIAAALNDYEILKNDFISMRDFKYEQLDALEIIKEKQVNVGDFIRCKSIEDYNDYCCYNEKEQLTREEYDLLKKVLL